MTFIPFNIPARAQGASARNTAVPDASACPTSTLKEAWRDKALTPKCRAVALIHAMTLDEKLSQLAETVDQKQQEKYGVPVLNMSDGPNGIATPPIPGFQPPMSVGVTAFPNEIALASSWDRSLANSFGKALAEEWRGKGSLEICGPTINLMRTWHWGRSAETYGEDPLLTGEMASAEVSGLQSKNMIAMVKHFTANNQDWDRVGHFPDFTGINEIIPQRALEEIYFTAMRSIVRNADPGAAMCSYNQINGTFSCDNAPVQKKLREWGFTGYNIPDAVFALHDPVLAMRAGVDQPNMWMPHGTIELLRDLRKKNLLDEAAVDLALYHMLQPIFRLGVYDNPATGTETAVVATPEHAALSKRMIEQGAVLLKNRNLILPLQPEKIKDIVIIGPTAGTQAITGEHGPFVRVEKLSVPAEAITERAGSTVHVAYHEIGAGTHPLPTIPSDVLIPESGDGHGLTASFYKSGDLSGTPAAKRVDATVDFHALPAKELGEQAFSFAAPKLNWSGRWTGTLVPPTTGNYVFSLHGGGTAHLDLDGKTVVRLTKVNFTSSSFGNVHLEAGKRVKVLLEHSNDYEVLGSFLQLGWYPPHTGEYEAALKAAQQADVAIVFAGEQLSEGMDKLSLNLPGDQDAMIEAVAARNHHTIVVLNTSTPVAMPWLNKVDAVLEAWYPGQESGAGIASVLFGDSDPGGRLPVTFPANETQGPAVTPETYPGVNGTVHYDEGILIGYRWFDQKKQEPLFPFGFGLSYTNFAFSALTAQLDHDDVVVKLLVKNIGSRAGTDVVQVYVEEPNEANEPPSQLKGFEKVALLPGESRQVSIRIPVENLKAWSDSAQQWKLFPGMYRIKLGESSRDIRLNTALQLTARPTSATAAEKTN
jgi:beta-glucosidase